MSLYLSGCLYKYSQLHEVSFPTSFASPSQCLFYCSTTCPNIFEPPNLREHRTNVVSPGSEDLLLELAHRAVDVFLPNGDEREVTEGASASAAPLSVQVVQVSVQVATGGV